MRIKIHSRRFNTELELDDAKILQMSGGLPGFLDSRRFCILELQVENSPFKWLHDVDNTDIAFLVTDPYPFFPDYHPQIPQILIEELGIRNIKSELMLFCIVSVTSGGHEAFANLRAPIIVNATTLVMRQVILESEEYAARTAIFYDQHDNVSKLNG